MKIFLFFCGNSDVLPKFRIPADACMIALFSPLFKSQVYLTFYR